MGDLTVPQIMKLNENTRLSTSKDAGYSPTPYPEDYVQEARHVQALTQVIGSADQHNLPRDPAAVEEYNKALTDYVNRYSINPGQVQTQNLQSSEEYQSTAQPNKQKNVGSFKDSAGDQIAQDPNSTMVQSPNEPMPSGNPSVSRMQNDPYNQEGGLTAISDSVGPAVAQNTEQTTLQDLFNKANARKQALSTDKKTQPAEQPTEQSDPWGIRVLKGIGNNLSGEAFSELLPSFQQGSKGVQGNPGTLLGGAYDGVVNVWNSMDGLAAWLNDTFDPKSSIANSVNDFVGKHILSTKTDIQSGNADIPTTSQLGVPPPEHTLGAIGGGMTRFMVGFIPVMKALKAASYTSLTAKGIAAVIASGSAGVTTAPQEGNLANLVQANPSLANVVTEAMAVNPTDTEWQARAKNALVAMGLTAVAEPFVWALSTLKGFRQAKGPTAGIPPLKVSPEDFSPAVKADNTAKINEIQTQLDATTTPKILTLDTVNPEGKVVLGKEFVGKPGETHADILAANKFTDNQLEGAQYNYYLHQGDPAIKIAQDEIAALKAQQEAVHTGATHDELINALPKEAQATATKGFVNKAGEFHTPEEMTAAIQKAQVEQAQIVAKGSTLRFAAKPGEGSVDKTAYENFINGNGSINKVLDTFSNTNMTMGQHIRQVVDRMSAMVFDKTRAPTTAEDLAKLAKQSGSSVYEFTRNHPDLVADPNRFTATVGLVNASKNSVVRMAEDVLNPKTLNSVSESSLYTFMRAINNHKAILDYLRTGDVEAATKMMNKTPIVKGTIPEQVNQMARSISDNGGAAKVRALAKLATKNPESFAQALSGPGKGSFTGITMQWYYFDLLSNPLTQMRNIYGNSVNLVWQIPVRHVAGEFNTTLSGAMRNPKGVAPGEAHALTYGMITSLREAVRTAGKTWKTGKPSDALGKMDEEFPNYLSSDRYGWTGNAAKTMDVLGYTATLPGRTLLSVDEFFKTVAKVGQTRALAYRQASAAGLQGDAFGQEIARIMASSDEGVAADAAAFGREVTFTQELGPWAQKLQDLVNSNIPIINYPALKLVIPFVRTTTNIFKEAGATSPMAILTKQFREDMAAGGARANLAAAKFAMGSTVSLLVGHEVLSDNITGHGPTDPGLRTTWMQTHRPNSVRISGWANDALEWLPGVEKAADGSRWIDYTPFQPLGTVVAVTASLTEALGPMRQDDFWKGTQAVALSLGNTVLSQTWGRSFSNFMDFIHGGNSGKQWIQNEIATMAVPGFVASVAHMSDPVWRQTNGLIDTMKARIPGWFPGNIGSTSLNARHNIAGQTIYSQALGPEIISPTYQFIPDGKPFFKWAWENQLPLKMPSKTQLGVDMTDDPANYEKFVMLAGNEAKINGKGWYDKMNDIIDGKDELSGLWARGTDGPNGMRAKIARTLISEYRKAAEAEMLKDPIFNYQAHQAILQGRYNMLTAPGDMPQ